MMADFLNLDVSGQLTLSASDLTGQRIAVLGASGGGKSVTVAVLAEEIMPYMPMTIIDSEGEMWGLRERYPVLIIGAESYADMLIPTEQAGAFAEWVWRSRVSVILDMASYPPAQRKPFLLAYLTALYEAANTDRRPHMLLIEECHRFIPQSGGDELKDILVLISDSGRKRGIGSIFVSQRSSKVDKDVLTSCGTVFLHRIEHPADLPVYREMIPLEPKAVKDAAFKLENGQAIVVRKRAMHTVQMRMRHTTHGGDTPTLDGISQTGATMQQIDADLMSQLRTVLSQVTPRTPSPTLSTKMVDGAKNATSEGEKTVTGAVDSAIGQGSIEALQDQINVLEAEVGRLAALYDSHVRRPAQMQLWQSDNVEREQSQEPVLTLVARDEQETIVEKYERTTHRSTRSIEMAQRRQRDDFKRLMQQVRGLGKASRSLLVFMMGLQGQSIPTYELARRLDYATNTITDAAGMLMRIGLVTRSKGAGGTFYWQFNVTTLFDKQYPDLDPDELLIELDKAA